LKQKAVSVIGLGSFPLVQPGDDLSKLVLEAARAEGVDLEDRDVLVIAHKIVSKSEGRLLSLRAVRPSNRAKQLALRLKRNPKLVESILLEAKEVLAIRHRVLVVRTRIGHVCLNSGLDKSNVAGKDSYSLLPSDPDNSARRLMRQIRKLTGKKVGVIICDTWSRPFRKGQVEFAVGVAGIDPVKDYRGRKDLFGYRLRFKYVGIADEIASAAELVMGQGSEATPVAIVRGLEDVEWKNSSSKKLVMNERSDLFSGALR